MAGKKNKVLELYSNFSAFGRVLKSTDSVHFTDIGADASLSKTILFCLHAARNADFLVLNIDHRRLLIACFVFMLVPRPLRRCRLISVDILLRPPKNFKQRLAALVKGFFLRRVDLFILYFKNIDGYVRNFYLNRKKVVYVPFKVNSWKKLVAKREAGIPDGDYVLLAGETFRDHATFAAAIRKINVPALIVLPPSAKSNVEHLPWFVSPPPSLKIEFHTDGKEDTYLGYFERARLVCLPRFKWDIASTGISAFFCSMALGKCVAISKGPGAEDIVSSEQALFFEPEDANSLATVIEKVWSSKELRKEMGRAAATFADTLQDEDKLLRGIWDAVYSRFVN